ncbi:MAG: hypothetical protein ACI4PF_05240 [Christensenellales bacterium]
MKEQKAERKQMRAEMKKSKKQPKTKREKVYKVVGVIFFIVVAVGAIAYAFRGTGGGYDWSKITGLTDEMKTKLSEPVDENELFGSHGKLNENDYNSCQIKLQSAGIDIENVDETQVSTPSGNFLLNSRELGILANNILSDLQSDQSIIIEYAQIYNRIEEGNIYFYEKIIVKVDLNKLIKDSNFPSIYVTTESKFEVQNKELVALNFSSIVNNLDENDSGEILDALNKTILIVNLDKVGTSYFNSSINLFNTLIGTKMVLYSDSIQFLV